MGLSVTPLERIFMSQKKMSWSEPGKYFRKHQTDVSPINSQEGKKHSLNKEKKMIFQAPTGTAAYSANGWKPLLPTKPGLVRPKVSVTTGIGLVGNICFSL